MEVVVLIAEVTVYLYVFVDWIKVRTVRVYHITLAWELSKVSHYAASMFYVVLSWCSTESAEG
jgi:hypothetical protein